MHCSSEFSPLKRYVRLYSQSILQVEGPSYTATHITSSSIVNFICSLHFQVSTSKLGDNLSGMTCQDFRKPRSTLSSHTWCHHYNTEVTQANLYIIFQISLCVPVIYLCQKIRLMKYRQKYQIQHLCDLNCTSHLNSRSLSKKDSNITGSASSPCHRGRQSRATHSMCYL